MYFKCMQANKRTKEKYVHLQNVLSSFFFLYMSETPCCQKWWQITSFGNKKATLTDMEELESNWYFAAIPKRVPLLPAVQARFTAVSRLSLTFWKMDPPNSEPSFLRGKNSRKLHHQLHVRIFFKPFPLTNNLMINTHESYL